jgi:hypothetical protein
VRAQLVGFFGVLGRRANGLLEDKERVAAHTARPLGAKASAPLEAGLDIDLFRIYPRTVLFQLQIPTVGPKNYLNQI